MYSYPLTGGLKTRSPSRRRTPASVSDQQRPSDRSRTVCRRAIRRAFRSTRSVTGGVVDEQLLRRAWTSGPGPIEPSLSRRRQATPGHAAWCCRPKRTRRVVEPELRSRSVRGTAREGCATAHVPHQGALGSSASSAGGSQRVATLVRQPRASSARCVRVRLPDEHDRSTVARQGLGIFSQSDEYRDDGHYRSLKLVCRCWLMTSMSSCL
jgi:hypothetical protein